MKSWFPTIHSALWYGLSLGLMAFAADEFQLGPWPHDPWLDAIPYLFGGFFAAGLGAFFDPNLRQSAHSGPQLWRTLQVRWLPLIPGVLALAALAESNGQVFIPASWRLAETMQMALLVIGSVLAVLGFWDRASEVERSKSEKDEQRVLFWAALGLITLLALVLRLWQLETAIHQFVDEMNFGRAAWGLLQPASKPAPLLAPFSTVTAFPWIYPYWQSLSIQVIGWNLSALRIVSVILGTATIPAMYFLTTTLFDRRLGLVAALLLATFPPHVHFSRMGINNIADPLAGVLMLAFLARGMRSGRQRDFALAGLCLGLTQYFYEGGRVVYPLLVLGWVAGLVILRRVHMTRSASHNFGAFALISLLIAAPMYYTLLAHDLPLLSRFETAGVGGSYYSVLIDYNRQQTLEEHLTRPFLIYVRNPDLSEFYGGKTPLLLVFVVPFFLLGLADSIWRLRRHGTLLAVMWLALVSVGGMLLAESGHTARFVVAFPSVMLLVMLGIWRVSFDRFAIALVITALVSLLQTNYYFNEHLEVYNDQRRQSLDYQDALFRVADLPEGAVACFVAENLPDSIMVMNMRDYLAPQLEICQVAPADLTLAYLVAMATVPKAFIVDPADSVTPLVLSQAYGADLVGPLLSTYDTVPVKRQYHLYLAP